MSRVIKTYEKWSHVGIPGCEFVDLKRQDDLFKPKYLPGTRYRGGTPVHWNKIPEYGRFQVDVSLGTSIMKSGEPSRRDLRESFEAIQILDGGIGELVVSNGMAWGIARAGATPWGECTRRYALIFRFRFSDVDTITLDLSGRHEGPCDIFSLSPVGSLTLKATRTISMPERHETRTKSSRDLFEALVKAASKLRIEDAGNETDVEYLTEVSEGGHRETDGKLLIVDLNHPDHEISIDEHGLREDRSHWPRPDGDR